MGVSGVSEEDQGLGVCGGLGSVEVSGLWGRSLQSPWGCGSLWGFEGGACGLRRAVGRVSWSLRRASASGSVGVSEEGWGPRVCGGPQQVGLGSPESLESESVSEVPGGLWPEEGWWGGSVSWAGGVGVS